MDPSVQNLLLSSAQLTDAALPRLLPSAPTAAVRREPSLATGTGVAVHNPPPTRIIGGQGVAIESEGPPPTAELVEAIHRAKTGALITTSIVSGGLYGAAAYPSSEDTIA